MSGSTASQHPQASAQLLEDTDTPTMDVDPAASLRALALSTLKRRKITTEAPASLPPRPIINDTSIQLNYGTEEPSHSASPAASPIAGPSSAVRTTSPSASARKTPTPMDVDDGVDQAREEGEISDSESAPAAKAAPVTPPKTVPAKPKPSALNLPMKPPPFASSPLVVASQLPKIEPTIHPLPEPPVPALSTPTPSSARRATPSEHGIDGDDCQVRPGLRMTQAQYDTAKDIVLDLLGWGVPPEYLVGCGVSREIIYFVFLELNLRLPTNLDTTGLPIPPNQQNVHYASPEPISPATPLFNQQRSQSVSSSRQSQGHHSLPQKPTVSHGATGDSSSLSATAAPFVPGLSSTPATPEPAPSLIDMELQRRQELLARKAVLASRRSKDAAAVAATASATTAPRTALESRITDPQDTPVVSVVPKQAVDDFLNSIGPVASRPSSRLTQDIDMDVDGPIPGLSSTLSGPADIQRSPRSSEAPSTTPSDTGPGGSTALSSSDSSSSSRRMSVDRETNGRGFARSGEERELSEPPTRQPSVGLRRGTKRPVAADFVDMEPGPSWSYHSSYHRYPARKRPNSFAAVSARKMVIDLSDTSDDEGDDLNSGLNATRHAHAQHHGRQHTRSMVAASVPSISSPAPAVTPAALLEKEQEIKKMREMIAKRERARKEKLAAASIASTPPIVDSRTMKVAVTVKQEEDDNEASESLKYTTSSSMKTNGDASGSVTPASTSMSSDSCSATPTDVKPPGLQHPAADDEVTVEAWQENTATATSPTIQGSPQTAIEPNGSSADTVDVDAGDSLPENPSTQEIEIPQAGPGSNCFIPYSSPLSLYPLLRTHSPRTLLDSISLQSTDPSAMTSDLSAQERPDSDDPYVAVGIDLRSMKAAAVNRWLSDPSKRLCQYEVPGGGECRDRDCGDIHPSSAWMVEPSDEETAQQLYAGLPKRSTVTLEQLQTALHGARQPNTGYYERVRLALEPLGLRILT